MSHIQPISRNLGTVQCAISCISTIDLVVRTVRFPTIRNIVLSAAFTIDAASAFFVKKVSLLNTIISVAVWILCRYLQRQKDDDILTIEDFMHILYRGYDLTIDQKQFLEENVVELWEKIDKDKPSFLPSFLPLLDEEALNKLTKNLKDKASVVKFFAIALQVRQKDNSILNTFFKNQPLFVQEHIEILLKQIESQKPSYLQKFVSIVNPQSMIKLAEIMQESFDFLQPRKTPSDEKPPIPIENGNYLSLDEEETASVPEPEERKEERKEKIQTKTQKLKVKLEETKKQATEKAKQIWENLRKRVKKH